MSKYGMTDSGKRQSFGKGMAIRDTADDKPRPDLISPFAEERQGHWLRMGAAKYAERNWENGMPFSRCVASLKRHLMKYQQGKRDEDHLAAIMFNAMALIHYEEMIERGRLPAELERHAELPAGPSGEEARRTAKSRKRPPDQRPAPARGRRTRPWLTDCKLSRPAPPQRQPAGLRGPGDDRHAARLPRNHPDRLVPLGLRLEAGLAAAALLHRDQAEATPSGPNSRPKLKHNIPMEELLFHAPEPGQGEGLVRASGSSGLNLPFKKCLVPLAHNWAFESSS